MPRVHHCGVTVSDLERSVEFYTDLLGLTVDDQFTLGSEEFNHIVGLEGQTADIAFLDGGTCQIELLDYHEQGENRNEGGEGNDIGVAHVNLAVDDIEAWYDELSGDVEFFSEPQTLEDGASVVSMYDPDGNVVELIEE
ncbi:VOC family protein [Halorubrum sp. CBA1125]|uniref:VOC family protein n=1 Tax=Halorubrum sp. CBA1125 TaxID=2668072 RepID=UPI0012E8A80E|nr:VOC family protein [Halorubrum sp. CBA1125]MUW13819.1 VOC family protein [Halorubrum sp. CBA1125]